MRNPMLATKDECVELSDWAEPGDVILVLGLRGRLYHGFAIYDSDLMWAIIDAEDMSEGGAIQRYEPEDITAWRPAYMEVGIEAELATKFPR